MKIDRSLIEKYNKPGPRYTSYPPATFFHTNYTSTDFIEHVKESNTQEPRNISFYFHVPFCPQLCHFCGCNTGEMQNKNTIRQYFDAMKKEFETIASKIDKSREVTQIHWGGGTPNAVSLNFISEMMALISNNFKLSIHCEIAMECNPAHLNLEQMNQLSEMGFNRISIGIQDFDEKVLQIINRRTSLLPLEEVVTYLKSKLIAVNLDFVYGLPGQTPESFEKTIERALLMKPQRIVTFSYAHVPWVKEAQKILEKYTIPDADTKLSMFEKAYNKLTENGYVAIGMDHFALPTDEMAVALSEHSLQRNFMGYCTKNNTGQVFAFGATSISQLAGSFSQNIKNTNTYIKTISENGIAIERGYQLTKTDLICNEVISEIMCNGRVILTDVATKFKMSVDELKKILNFEDQMLQTFIDDQLIDFDGNELLVRLEGRMVLRNIAMAFDPLYVEGGTKYSKTM